MFGTSRLNIEETKALTVFNLDFSERVYLIDPPEGFVYDGRLFQYSTEEVIEGKARLIDNLGVNAFFEDNPEIVKALRGRCPNVAVIQYRGEI